MPPLHLSAGGLISKNKSEVLIFTRISLFYFIFFCFFASAFLRGKNLFYLRQKLFGVCLPSRIIQLHQLFAVPAKHMIANRFAPLRAADMQMGKRRIFHGNFLGGRELMPPLLPSFFGQPFILDILIILLFGIPFPAEAGIARIQMPSAPSAFCIYCLVSKSRFVRSSKRCSTP